jgi:RNA-binding protein
LAGALSLSMRGRMMEKKKLYQLKSEANQIDPIINIGKNGVTDTLIEELNKQIKAKKLVKVRVLKSAEEGKDLKAIAEEIASATRSTLIEIRGRIVVLYR